MNERNKDKQKESMCEEHREEEVKFEVKRKQVFQRKNV